MSELPKGWVEAKLGDVCDYVQRGKSPKYTGRSDLPVINQKCVRWWGIEEQHLKFVDPEQWSKWTEERFLQPGDILWNSTGTGTIGRAALYQGLETTKKAVVDSHVTILRSNLATSGEFLHRYIKSPDVQSKIADMQSGTTNQVELNRTEIVETRLPLPPLAEQKRIVAKLDALSARSARARKDLARIDTLVTRYKQAILSKAFQSARGVLQSLDELVSSDAPIRYGVLQPGKIKDSGVQLVRVCDLVSGRVAWKQLRRIDPEIDMAFSKARISNGDILLSVVGTIGRIALVTDLTEPTNIARAVARLRPDKDKVLPEWLALRLHAGDCQVAFAGDAREVARKTLNVSKVRAVRVFVPPLAEQKEIVRRIESAFEKIDRLAAEAKRALELTDKLDEAILAKAFRGELVPQDPADEPASTLLARIKANRAAVPKPKRGRGKKV